MDVGGFWRSPKKRLLRTHLAIFILLETVRCKEKTQQKHLLPCHTIMHHKSRFLESVRWTSCTAGIAVSGFRTGWSDFGRFFCALLCGRHQTKTSFSQLFFTTDVTWLFRFDLRFCLRYGEFSLFFWLFGSNVLQNATWWARPMAGGRRRRFESQNIRIRKRVFPFRWREVHLTKST